MTDKYSGRHAAQRRMEDADQAEWAAIRLGSAVYDAGVYDDRVAAAMDDFRPAGLSVGAAWQETDLEIDTAVGQVHEEVVRRTAVMGAAYPFDVSQNTLSYRASATRFYEFCLAVSLAPNLSTGNYAKLPKFFERAVTILVREYLGRDSQALHVGTPRDSEIGIKFRKAMETLHTRSNEWIWSPRPDLPDNPDTKGDEGVDFVAWKETLDRRNGRLFILGQCSCGDDWTGKLSDVNLNRLQKWFQPLSFAQPVRAFATPRHIASDWLNEALGQAGLVFDRARLAIVAERPEVQMHLLPWITKMTELTDFVAARGGATGTDNKVAA